MTTSIDSLDYESQELIDLGGKENPYHSHMDMIDIVAKWIRESRESAGMNQAELGERIGVGKANVSAWELKKHSPSISQITRIGQICKTPLPKEVGVENQLTPEALRFALSYQMLPTEFRKQILDALTTAEIAARSLQSQQKT